MDLSEVKKFEKQNSKQVWRRSRALYLARLLREAEQRGFLQIRSSFVDKVDEVEAYCAMGAAYRIASRKEVIVGEDVGTWVSCAFGGDLSKLVYALNDREGLCFEAIAEKLERME